MELYVRRYDNTSTNTYDYLLKSKKLFTIMNKQDFISYLKIIYRVDK